MVYKIFLFIVLFLFYSTGFGLPRTPRYEPNEKKTVYVSPNVYQPAAVYQRGPNYLPPFSSLFPVQTSTPQTFVTNSSIEKMVKNLFDNYMNKNSTHLPPSAPPSPPLPPPLPPLPPPPSECSSAASGTHTKCKNFLYYLNNK